MSRGEHKLEAEVLTPEGPVFKGELIQVSARTKVGDIGILANHAPVMARLVPSELRLHTSESEIERFAAAEGWLEVFANRVRVLVAEAIKPEDLDSSELQERVKEAEQALSEAEEGSAAAEQAELDKARAEAFLELAGSSSS